LTNNRIFWKAWANPICFENLQLVADLMNLEIFTANH